MNEQMILSVVIVTWNSKNETLACLDSIFGSDDYKLLNEKLEIIIIDNNSSDGTAKEVSEKYPDVVLIENDVNKGYAPACNQGMIIAKGTYSLLLGSDTVLKNNALIECIKYLDSNGHCGAVGAKLLYPDGKIQGNCKKFPNLRNAFCTYLSLDRFNKVYDMASFEYNKTIEVDQIATTFLMVRTDILRNIKYFDENYKILYNDVDLCKRIWNYGSSIVFIHTAVVIHYGNLSTKKADYRIRIQMYKDIYRYYRANSGIFAFSLIPVLAVRFFLILLFK